VAQADILGQSYEYFIKKFADATNKKAGEFYMPRSVVRLMVNMLDPREGESIYDPACGTGGMLQDSSTQCPYVTNGVSILQTNSARWPPCNGHALPPRWSGA
jgi:hypothetical protein